MTYYVSVPNIFVLTFFVFAYGGVAYYLWKVIQKHRKILSDLKSPRGKRAYAIFTLIVVPIPFLAFVFGFIYTWYEIFKWFWHLIFSNA